MAYDSSSCVSGSCTRLNFWSNPDRNHNGEPTGVPIGQSNPADNRMTLNDSAYTVANFRSSTVGDPYEPDNDSTTAKTILSGQSQTHSIHIATDIDRITFTLPAASSIEIQTSGTTGDDTRMWLYDSALNELAFNDDIGYQNYHSKITLNYLPAGIYYVKIDEWNNNNIIDSYQLDFTADVPMATITSPTSDSILEGLGQIFTWDSAGQIVDQWWLFAGSSPNSADYFFGGNSLSKSVTVTGLPYDGSTVYVTIWYLTGGIWKQLTAEYTASEFFIYHPTPNSTLPGATAIFEWYAVVGGNPTLDQWWLFAGSYEDGYDYFVGTNIEGTNVNVTGLPTDGSTVYVTIWIQVSGHWLQLKETYTAPNIHITSPSSGLTLSGSSETISWTVDNTFQEQWWIFVGDMPGSANYFYGGGQDTATNVLVTGLPTNGSTVYVQMWLLISGSWVQLNTSYQAAGGPS